MKSWLQDNDLEMHSGHNERKSVVAERFTRTLTNKIYKYITSISKFLHIDKLDDIVNKYNNTCHWTTKMKPVDVKLDTYFILCVENNDKDPKFEVDYHVRISKYQNIFGKGHTSNWSEEFLWLKKVQNSVPWTYVIVELNEKEIA